MFKYCDCNRVALEARIIFCFLFSVTMLGAQVEYIFFLALDTNKVLMKLDRLILKFIWKMKRSIIAKNFFADKE